MREISTVCGNTVPTVMFGKVGWASRFICWLSENGIVKSSSVLILVSTLYLSDTGRQGQKTTLKALVIPYNQLL